MEVVMATHKFEMGDTLDLDYRLFTSGASAFLGLPDTRKVYVLWPIGSDKYEVRWPPKGPVIFWEQVPEQYLTKPEECHAITVTDHRRPATAILNQRNIGGGTEAGIDGDTLPFANARPQQQHSVIFDLRRKRGVRAVPLSRQLRRYRRCYRPNRLHGSPRLRRKSYRTRSGSNDALRAPHPWLSCTRANHWVQGISFVTSYLEDYDPIERDYRELYEGAWGQPGDNGEIQDRIEKRTGSDADLRRWDLAEHQIPTYRPHNRWEIKILRRERVPKELIQS